jgi:hypothetical protein
MPLQIPLLDDRSYRELLDEALARIPVHTPEWNNFNKSDPGVTLIEIFAFLTENLLYRSNQIPERNRRKFLSLLGIGLTSATPARGLVTFANERGPLQTITLNGDLEVLAGEVPFRTEQGLDVLPIEARVFIKAPAPSPSPEMEAYYRQLYASYHQQALEGELRLYEAVPLCKFAEKGVNLGSDSVDGALWIALLARKNEDRDAVRRQIGGKTMSLGIMPALGEFRRTLRPGGDSGEREKAPLLYEIPVGGTLPEVPSRRQARYLPLETISPVNVLTEPAVVQIKLPDPEKLRMWDNLDPLEMGAMDFPPALEDTDLNDRLVTWVRIRSSAALEAKLSWVGINAAMVSQRARIVNENLPAGTGAPDQAAILSQKPVIAGSVRLKIVSNGQSEPWEEIDDISCAGPEVPAYGNGPTEGGSDLRAPVKAFMLDAEAGMIRFGDGLRGARPPYNAVIRADYDYSMGSQGNVNKAAIAGSPALPGGIKVTNPVRTWGGADAETVADGEKQIARFLQHRDRLVTTEDFRTITPRTPGVEIGRVEVVPGFNPELVPNVPGDAPGAVTLMVIPTYDPVRPHAPRPDRLFLNTICSYIDRRRLITTEVFLRGPDYKKIWVSIGIEVKAGWSVAQVREAVRERLQQFLSPLPEGASGNDSVADGASAKGDAAASRQGWLLEKSVVALELLAEANRVEGVLMVNQVLLAEADKDHRDTVEMHGLELPEVEAVSVAVGDPIDLDVLRGRAAQETVSEPSGADGEEPSLRLIPVPIVPRECG